MTEQSPAVLTKVIDSIAVIRFNRPAERNPLSHSTLLELKSILAQVVDNGAIKTIILHRLGRGLPVGCEHTRTHQPRFRVGNCLFENRPGYFSNDR